MWMDIYVYPIYRFLISTGLLVWTCVEVPLEIQQSKELCYFLYATNWAFLIYAFSSNVFAIFCTFFNCNKDKKIPKWFAELLWFIYGMSMNTVLVTSLVYWAAFWDPAYSQFYRPESKVKHLMPASTVLMDVWINGLPIRLFHAIYPSILGMTYTIFSYLYYDAGNINPIYPVLDWSRPIDAATASLLTITISLIIQVFLYLLYIGRITLSAHLGGRGVQVVEEWWNGGSEICSKTPAVEALNFAVVSDIEAAK
ncbi:hypothetical protein Aperf_G00000099200 [Anoplocephala perfoliata]